MTINSKLTPYAVRVKKAGVCHVIVELGSVRHSLVVVSLRELLDFRK
jgi:hypothetical protein